MAEVQDITYIKNMLLTLHEKQDKLAESQADTKERLGDIEGQLSKISQTVIGNEEFGQKGLVKQVADLNKYVERDKLTNAKIMGGLTVIGVIWSLVLKFILKS